MKVGDIFISSSKSELEVKEQSSEVCQDLKRSALRIWARPPWHAALWGPCRRGSLRVHVSHVDMAGSKGLVDMYI